MATAETLITDDTNPQPGAAGDLRSSGQIALTKHVDGFKIPRSGDDEVAEEAEDQSAELEAIKLPKSLKGAHALLQEILATEPEDRAGQKLKVAKLAKVRAHLTTLEEGTAAPVITMAIHKAITSTATAHAQAIKLKELGRVYPEVLELLTKCASLEQERETLSLAAVGLAKLTNLISEAKNLEDLKLKLAGK